MSMTVAEAGQLGGRATAKALTAEQRRSGAKKARFSGLVNAVASRVDELTEEQRNKLLDALLGLDPLDEDAA